MKVSGLNKLLSLSSLLIYSAAHFFIKNLAELLWGTPKEVESHYLGIFCTRAAGCRQSGLISLVQRSALDRSGRAISRHYLSAVTLVETWTRSVCWGKDSAGDSSDAITSPKKDFHWPTVLI